MPPPRWLVDGVFPAGGLIGLYGQSGAKKSFIAIDVALSVATGVAWNGHEVERGYVVYISAEGNAGIAKRVLAWLVHHQVAEGVPQIAWLLESIPVNIDSEQMVVLIERVVHEVQSRPSLVVIDTMARCFDGSENETEDMGRFIAGVDQLRREFECAALVVHHTRLGGDRERGNTAFRGAADTMLSVVDDSPIIRVSCNKQKDAEEFEEIELELLGVPGTESCVVQANTQRANTQQQGEALVEALRGIQPARWDDWVEATGLTKNQFMRVYVGIKKANLVQKSKGGLWGVKGVPPKSESDGL